MAKIESIFEIQGTISNYTFVKTKDGTHLRAKRGTYKEAKLNRVLKKSSKELAKSNRYAKMIKDSLDKHRAEIFDGTMWRRLNSIIRKQYSSITRHNYRALKEFRMNSAHSLESVVDRLVCATKVTRKKIHIAITIQAEPRERIIPMDRYNLTILAIHCTTKLTATTRVHEFVAQDFTTNPQTFELSLAIPANATATLIAAKINGTNNGQLIPNKKAIAMEIVDVV